MSKATGSQHVWTPISDKQLTSMGFCQKQITFFHNSGDASQVDNRTQVPSKHCWWPHCELIHIVIALALSHVNMYIIKLKIITWTCILDISLMYRCNIYFIDASMLIYPSKLNYILILFVDICTKNPQESASMYLHTFQMLCIYICVCVCLWLIITLQTMYTRPQIPCKGFIHVLVKLFR